MTEPWAKAAADSFMNALFKPVKAGFCEAKLCRAKGDYRKGWNRTLCDHCFTGLNEMASRHQKLLQEIKGGRPC